MEGNMVWGGIRIVSTTNANKMFFTKNLNHLQIHIQPKEQDTSVHKVLPTDIKELICRTPIIKDLDSFFHRCQKSFSESR